MYRGRSSLPVSRDDYSAGEVARSGTRLFAPSGYYQMVLGDEAAPSGGNARARDEPSRRAVDERDGGRMAGANRDLIVVGASAGGVEALREFVRGLPGGLPAAVLVVLHLRGEMPRCGAAIAPLRLRQFLLELHNLRGTQHAPDVQHHGINS